MSFNNIEPLSGTNFKRWKSDLEIYLGLTDIDIAIREDAPPVPAEDDDVFVKARYDRWARANRMALLIMKRTMSEPIRGGIPACDNAKEYLESIANRFKESDKVEVSSLISQLTNADYNGKGCVREHILNMIEVRSQLSNLNVNIEEHVLVHFILQSLPIEYKQLKSTYNAQKESWDLNELITICVNEELNQRKEKDLISQINLVQDIKKPYPKDKKKDVAKPYPKKHAVHGKVNKAAGIKCFFCKKIGHMKKECRNYKKWLDKQKTKGKIHYLNVCFESNLVDMPKDSWWYDTGATIHVTNSLQGFKNKRVPKKDEVTVFIGNGERIAVEFIGDVELQLDSGFILVLKDVVYIPSIRRNLVSGSRLAKSNYRFELDVFGFTIYENKVPIGTGLIMDDLFRSHWERFDHG